MPTMASITLFILLTTCLPILLTRAAVANVGSYIPVTYKIPPKVTECLYNKFDKSDFVTFSVFVVKGLNGGVPAASIMFEGPVAGNDAVRQKAEEKGLTDDTTVDDDRHQELNKKDGLGTELLDGVDMWFEVKDADKGVRYDKRIGMISRSLRVDWSHAGESEDAEAARSAIEREKREAYRNRARGTGDDDDAGGEGREERLEKFRTIIQAKIEPFEETNAIKAEGWYRLCVSAGRGVTAEMDLRSGKELGGVDRSTGHVYTREMRETIDEERRIDEEMTAAEEGLLDANTRASADGEREKEAKNQVREQDLHSSKEQIKKLNTVVADLSKKHKDYQRRLFSHMEHAARNRQGLARGAKLETMLYVVLTGVQVFTVRRWLLGNNMLGS